MAQIGLKNFRRFKNLEPIKLGTINIMVGKNNAGKSTIAKAAMLVLYNLRRFKWMEGENKEEKGEGRAYPVPLFNFNADDGLLHIGTFERARCNYSDDKRIVFNFGYGLMEFTITVANIELENKSYAPIESIKIRFDDECIFDLDFSHGTMSFEVLHTRYYENLKETGVNVSDVTEEYGKLIEAEKEKADLAFKNKQYVEFATIGNNINKLRNELKIKIKRTRENKQTDELKATFGLEHIKSTNSGLLVDCIKSFKLIVDNEFDYIEKVDKRTKEYHDFMDNRLIVEEFSSIIDDAIDELKEIQNKVHIEYIQAHTATHRLILNANDKNDVNSLAVHDYYQEQVQPGEQAERFVKTWLKNFEIGTDLKIEALDGEGYYLKIKTDTGWVHLADLGMGSIQLVILILRLATLINRSEYSIDEALVIIEEPEQNIHPKLQGRLAEMFVDVTKRVEEPCPFRFLIETHSEYLIRKVQLIVSDIAKEYGEKDFMEHNPFRVYYFPSENDKQPYDMGFKPNGRFVNSFGEGFYDAAGTLAMELSNKEENEESSQVSFDWPNTTL